jgi:hypothetical protein
MVTLASETLGRSSMTTVFAEIAESTPSPRASRVVQTLQQVDGGARVLADPAVVDPLDR